MNLGHLRGVIFDFDGTLAPNLDLPEMRRRVIELTLDAGVPETIFEDHYIIEIIEAAAEWLRTSNGRDGDTYHTSAHQLITDFELGAASRLEPFPEVRQLLGNLRAADIATAVVTRNCEQAVRNTFPDIDDHLDLLLARDNVKHYKPDPRHLEAALTGLGTSSQAAAMIGDGAMDMQLGRQLGLTCIGVLTGSQEAHALRAAGADLVLEHVRELDALLFNGAR